MYTAQKFLSSIKTYTSCLGQGAFGIVLKSMDESDTPSAVKFLFPIDYYDRDKLRREYTVTKYLQHENIVQILDVEESELTLDDINQIFKDLPSNEKLAMLNFRCRGKANSSISKTIESICIKMEPCGSNLRDWLNQKHNPNELHIQTRQTRIIQGMTTGLNYLHGNKIIHRDLKPENIMFSRGKYQLPVKIGDFGHSRLIHSDDSRTGPMTGTVGTQVYTAPEVSSGNYNHQADLFSLGLIIWEVAQVIEESKRRNLFDTLVNDKDENLVQDHPIMTGIKDIIIGLTKRKPADRTKTLVEIYTAAWEATIVDEVTRRGFKSLWDAISSNSKNYNVQTAEEFKLAIDNAREGCTVKLADGEYSGGEFILWENGVKIVGKGAGTVLRRVNPSHVDFLTFFGSQCTISDVKIILDNPLCPSLRFGIVLKGDTNAIENVEVHSSGGRAGIQISGSRNTVSHVFLNKLQNWGIVIEPNSNTNTISNITGVDLGQGIWVCGSNNTISEITLEKRIGSNRGDGVWLYSIGSSNTISKLTCSGYDLHIDSLNTTVKDSQCGTVGVWGDNATLTNVNCGELIKIDSTVDGVNLVHCYGNKLEASDKVGVINCQFFEVLKK